jgi:hypothetical protein
MLNTETSGAPPDGKQPCDIGVAAPGGPYSAPAPGAAVSLVASSAPPQYTLHFLIAIIKKLRP